MIGRRSLPLAIAAALVSIARARPAEARPEAFVPLAGRAAIPVQVNGPTPADLAAFVQRAVDRSNAELRQAVARRGPLRREAAALSSRDAQAVDGQRP